MRSIAKALAISSGILLVSGDTGGFNEGDIVSIRCSAAPKNSQKQFLDGWVGGARVSLARDVDTDHTGTRWRVKVNPNKTVSFQSLGENTGNVWLDCRPNKNGEVGLINVLGRNASGTGWSVEKSTRGDVYSLRCFSVVPDARFIYLNGNTGTGGVGLTAFSNGASARWEITRNPKINQTEAAKKAAEEAKKKADDEKRIQEAAKKLLEQQAAAKAAEAKKREDEKRIQEAAKKLLEQQAAEAKKKEEEKKAQEAALAKAKKEEEEKKKAQEAALEKAKKEEEEKKIHEVAKKILAEKAAKEAEAKKKAEEEKRILEAAHKLIAEGKIKI